MSDKFDFVVDRKLRDGLEKDYAILERAAAENLLKAVYVFSGSIVEAILLDYLSSLKDPRLPYDTLVKWDLAKLVEECHNAGVISDQTEKLLSVIRNYRNLIHPGRELRLGQPITKDGAAIAKHVVDLVLLEVKEKSKQKFGYTAEQMVSKILSDRAAISIVTHLMKDMNSSQLEELLTITLPEKYLELQGDPDPFVSHENALHNIRECYQMIVRECDTDTKRAIAAKYASVVRNQNDYVINTYDEAFLSMSVLGYLDSRISELVFDHLLFALQQTSQPAFVYSIRGMHVYLDPDRQTKLLKYLTNKAVKRENEDLSLAARICLVNSFGACADRTKSAFLKELSQVASKVRLENRNFYQKLVNELEFVQDIPF